MLIAAGGLILATAGFWQWSGLTAHPAYLSQWLTATVLTGIGVGLTISPLASAAAHALPANRYAIGGAFNSAVRQVGSVLGVALEFALLGVRSQRAAVTDFQARGRVDGRVRSGDDPVCRRDRNETPSDERIRRVIVPGGSSSRM